VVTGLGEQQRGKQHGARLARPGRQEDLLLRYEQFYSLKHNSGAGTEGRRRAARLCTAALRAELAGLGVQFLLGMYVNLFVPRLNWQPVLIAHMVLGIGLVCGAAVAAASAIVSRDGRRIAVTGAGLAALVLAATGGIRFVFAGQDNVYSYLMAVGFILAVAVFGAGLGYIERRDRILRTAAASTRSAQAPADRAVSPNR